MNKTRTYQLQPGPIIASVEKQEDGREMYGHEVSRLEMLLVMLVERLEALVEEVARVREALISMKPSR